MKVDNINTINTISYSSNDKSSKQTFVLNASNPIVLPDLAEFSRDKEKQKKYGTALAITTLGVGFTALALGKGLNRKGRLNLNKLNNYFIKKSNEFSQKKIFTKGEEFTKNVVNTGKGITQSTRAVMNTISLKDILFKKVTDPIPGLGKACQLTTDFFEKVAITTTINSYANTSKAFEKMYNQFSNANDKVPVDIGYKSRSILKSVKKIYDYSFGIGEITNRIENSKKTFEKLDENFWQKSFSHIKELATNKDTYSSFIAEKMLAGDKSRLIADVNTQKAKLHFTPKDDFNNLKSMAEDIRGMIDPFKQETNEILENIKSNLDTVAKKNSPLAKEAVIKDMTKLTNFIDDTKIAEQFRQSITELPKSQPGKLQVLLSLYKNELNAKDYKKLEDSVNNAIKSLNKSTQLETDNLFDKMRDLKIGSAPTDMVTLLTTFATVGIGLSKAKDDDERASAALKFGIPAIGTVMTSMYGTLKMFSAGQSLIFGAITGLIINKIGEAADNLRLQAKGQRTKEEAIFTQPTVNEVRDAIVANNEVLLTAKQVYDGTEFVVNTVSDAANTIKVKFDGYKQSKQNIN